MKKADRERLLRAGLVLVKPEAEACLCDLPDHQKGKVKYNKQWRGECDKCGLAHRVIFKDEVR